MKAFKLLPAAVLLAFAVNGPFLSAQDYPFRNPDLPIDERVVDLISRMTLEEKVSQMQFVAPPVERLGIPAYNWWNECLHGVSRSQDKVTTFPQSIGLAATFDESGMLKVGEILATEGRAIFNEANRLGKGGAQFKGLTFWNPNINIFRDPRWGRGQETYGEDPYLTGLLGKAIVRGMEGTDSLMLKVSACAKHYAVHSGPEPLRHVFNAETNVYDLWDTYLPAFRDLVVDADISSVMGAYNRLNGQPASASDVLLTEVLRGYWGFEGYVTSDCGAIDDFFRGHKTHPDEATAAADAVRHTTDLDCGAVYAYLTEAVARGLITEEEIDQSLARLMKTRFRLGMFDPADRDPYATLPYSALESEDSKAHALKMAHESMVLLKNNGILPLKHDIRQILLLGPNVDAPIAQLGNYTGYPTEIVTPLMAIKEKTGAEVKYLKACDYTLPDNTDAEISDAVKEADLVIFVGGLSPQLEGEDGDAGREKYEGFKGADRTTIMMPKVQTEVMKIVKNQGKPLIFVSMSGSAIAFPWENENADAILQAWYGGQSAGTAIADILWGDYNPSGRLPVTFYADDSQLPDFEDYSMAGRTYRYFDGQPMYPFGYGLSYTEFEYGKPVCLEKNPKTGESITVVSRVRNTGRIAGDEVVQLYVSHPDAPEPKPLRALKGVKRISLMPGEEQMVMFELDARDLSLVDETGVSNCLPGTVEIFVGGGQPCGGDNHQYVSVRVKGKSVALPR